jgi:protein SCO1/2
MALKLRSPDAIPTMRHYAPPWVRSLWTLEVLALSLVVVGAGILVYWHHQSAPAQLVGGAIVKDRPAAPDFALADQFGATETMRALRGRAIALTFLYTNCPDVCPLIAANLHETYKQLGNLAPQVQLMAVTVDPEHDSTDTIRQFSDQRGLTNEWLFLNGSRDQLTPVWSAYHITAQPDATPAKPVSPAAQREARGLPPAPDTVEHSAPIFLIDKRGAIRAMLPVDATPDTLTTDLRVLVNET